LILIDKVKNNVHMADIFLNWSSQRCNELFWQCYKNGILSVYYQNNGICRNLGEGEVRYFLCKLNIFMLANSIWKMI